MKLIRRLSQAEFYRVCEWLKSNTESLIENAPSLVKLCELCEEETGIIVVDSTMRSAINASGVVYNSKYQGCGKRLNPQEQGELLKQVEALRIELALTRSQLATVESDQAITIAWVRELAAALGHKLSGDVTDSKTTNCVAPESRARIAASLNAIAAKRS